MLYCWLKSLLPSWAILLFTYFLLISGNFCYILFCLSKKHSCLDNKIHSWIPFSHFSLCDQILIWIWPSRDTKTTIHYERRSYLTYITILKYFKLILLMNKWMKSKMFFRYFSGFKKQKCKLTVHIRLIM